MKYWQIVSGEFYPQRYSFGKLYFINDIKTIERELIKKRTSLLCLSDHESISDFQQLKEEITGVFQHIFPNKSTFEL